MHFWQFLHLVALAALLLKLEQVPVPVQNPLSSTVSIRTSRRFTVAMEQSTLAATARQAAVSLPVRRARPTGSRTGGGQVPGAESQQREGKAGWRRR